MQEQKLVEFHNFERLLNFTISNTSEPDAASRPPVTRPPAASPDFWKASQLLAYPDAHQPPAQAFGRTVGRTSGRSNGFFINGQNIRWPYRKYQMVIPHVSGVMYVNTTHAQSCSVEHPQLSCLINLVHDLRTAP